MKRGIARGLISVWDKGGLEGLVGGFRASGVEVLASGGTYARLRELGVPAVRVEEETGVGALLGGRVKTLHPRIFGGILARRDSASDGADLRDLGARGIDLVVVDLYPFESALAEGADEEALIEKIDIGGVSLLRAAAKNFRDVVVISSRAQYGLLAEVLEHGGETTLGLRRELAARAFEVTARYDGLIAGYFGSTLPGASGGVSLASALPLEGSRVGLRYGENPHQEALFVGDLGGMFTQLHGKELSYNNLLDLHCGVGLIDEFTEPTVAILKHGTPCGVGCGASLWEAWSRALGTDPESAFGGVVVMNRPVDVETARGMDSIFFEVCLSPDYAGEGLSLLRGKKNRVLLRRGAGRLRGVSVRSALNGVLVQGLDARGYDVPLGRVVTSRGPTASEEASLLLANRVVKHCKSNAVVLARDGMIVGVGAGTTSRVDALRQALDRADRFGHTVRGAVLASDAFFPFADCVELARDRGVTAIVQPGGSMRDGESISACEAGGVAMVFTGYRHFKH